MFHSSRGQAEPASPHLLSEPAIVAGLAKATLPPNPKVPWDRWVGDYAAIRASIEETWPVMFKDFERRMDIPGGFPKPLPARERQFHTPTGRANFIVPPSLSASFDEGGDPDVLRLMTLRSNDQFNTTVYGYDDRFRGIQGTRMVALMNRDDMGRFGIRDGDTLTMSTAVSDGVERRVEGLRAVPYNIPKGCVGGYYPELNALIPLWQHAERSHVPAAKSVPVRVSRGG